MSVGVSLPETNAQEPEQSATLSRREVFGLTLPWFALNFQIAALLPVVFPTHILPFMAPGLAGTAQQALLLGAMATLGTATALVRQPTVGALFGSHLHLRRPVTSLHKRHVERVA